MSLHKELAKWSSVESGPFFPVDTTEDWLGETLPQDYLINAKSYGGREGFFGQQYLRLYRPVELRALNEAYDIGRYHPGIVMFGSDGYGEGFGFLRCDGSVLKFPLIPLPIEGEKMDKIAPNFEVFIRFIADIPATLKPNPSCVGKELHLKQPLCFGGDFKNPENQVMVPVSKHPELVCYWNNLYRNLLAQQQDKTA
jgi:hypothetical protein